MVKLSEQKIKEIMSRLIREEFDEVDNFDNSIDLINLANYFDLIELEKEMRTDLEFELTQK